VVDHEKHLGVGERAHGRLGKSREFAIPGEFEPGRSDEEKGNLSEEDVLADVDPHEALQDRLDLLLVLDLDHHRRRQLPCARQERAL
jgi:hypothetical protein